MNLKAAAIVLTASLLCLFPVCFSIAEETPSAEVESDSIDSLSGKADEYWMDAQGGAQRRITAANRSKWQEWRKSREASPELNYKNTVEKHKTMLASSAIDGIIALMEAHEGFGTVIIEGGNVRMGLQTSSYMAEYYADDPANIGEIFLTSSLGDMIRKMATDGMAILGNGSCLYEHDLISCSYPILFDGIGIVGMSLELRFMPLSEKGKYWPSEVSVYGVSLSKMMFHGKSPSNEEVSEAGNACLKEAEIRAAILKPTTASVSEPSNRWECNGAECFATTLFSVLINGDDGQETKSSISNSYCRYDHLNHRILSLEPIRVQAWDDQVTTSSEFPFVAENTVWDRTFLPGIANYLPLRYVQVYRGNCSAVPLGSWIGFTNGNGVLATTYSGSVCVIPSINRHISPSSSHNSTLDGDLDVDWDGNDLLGVRGGFEAVKVTNTSRYTCEDGGYYDVNDPTFDTASKLAQTFGVDATTGNGVITLDLSQSQTDVSTRYKRSMMQYYYYLNWMRKTMIENTSSRYVPVVRDDSVPYRLADQYPFDNGAWNEGSVCIGDDRIITADGDSDSSYPDNINSLAYYGLAFHEYGHAWRDGTGSYGGDPSMRNGRGDYLNSNNGLVCHATDTTSNTTTEYTTHFLVGDVVNESTSRFVSSILSGFEYVSLSNIDNSNTFPNSPTNVLERTWADFSWIGGWKNALNLAIRNTHVRYSDDIACNTNLYYISGFSKNNNWRYAYSDYANGSILEDNITDCRCYDGGCNCSVSPPHRSLRENAYAALGDMGNRWSTFEVDLAYNKRLKDYYTNQYYASSLNETPTYSDDVTNFWFTGSLLDYYTSNNMSNTSKLFEYQPMMSANRLEIKQLDNAITEPDRDQFMFYAVNGKTYTIRVTAITTTASFSFSITDGHRNALASSTPCSDNTRYACLSYSPTYSSSAFNYLRVSERSNGNGQYSISIKMDNDDIGDTVVGSEPLPYYASKNGRIDSTSDIDWFRIWVPGRQSGLTDEPAFQALRVYICPSTGQTMSATLYNGMRPSNTGRWTISSQLVTQNIVSCSDLVYTPGSGTVPEGWYFIRLASANSTIGVYSAQWYGTFTTGGPYTFAPELYPISINDYLDIKDASNSEEQIFQIGGSLNGQASDYYTLSLLNHGGRYASLDLLHSSSANVSIELLPSKEVLYDTGYNVPNIPGHTTPFWDYILKDETGGLVGKDGRIGFFVLRETKYVVRITRLDNTTSRTPYKLIMNLSAADPGIVSSSTVLPWPAFN